jgi:SnoaL-like polyketide cyclase
MATPSELMARTDDSWNARDWDAFEALHDPDCVVYWPGFQDTPTKGVSDHHAESEAFCDAFPDNKVHNRPYHILFGDDGSSCFVTRFTGTFTQPWKLPDGTSIEPTGRSFDILYSTTARWNDGRITEEYPFWDSATFRSQIGLA